jgi:2'-5' RNA ligase
MAQQRVFVGVALDEPIRRRAKQLVESVAATTTCVKWVSPANLHVTLKFLGDLPDADVYPVCQEVAAAVADYSSFPAFCRRLGAFPHLDRPRTIWLGVDDPEDRLTQLHQRIETALERWNFPRETRAFRPHATLGRVRERSRRIDRLVQRLRDHEQVELGRFEVRECTLFASELLPAGPVYTVLSHAVLCGASHG